MKVLLRSLVVIVLLNIASYSQMGQHSAPVVWERYRTATDGVSVMLPKMPVREGDANPCSELKRSTFFVYAEGVVYELGVYEKMPKNVANKCYGTVTPFGSSTLQKRLDEIAKPDAFGIKPTIEARDANRFTAKDWTRLVISEVDERQRWIELAVHHYEGDTPDFDRFLKSIDLSAKLGKEIGDGVESVFGDPMQEAPTAPQAAKSEPGNATSDHQGNGSAPDTKAAPASTAPVKAYPYRTVSQPKARYTEAARRANVQGAVRLKITLYANGEVGDVVVVKELSDGLTENAIAAAKRIVFLPKRWNDVPMSVVITREYTFTIY